MLNAMLGKNVRTLRAINHWTQQHLADAADVLLRTIQRVEKGDGASTETELAIAGAFNVSVDLLRLDFEALLKQHQEQQATIEKDHHIIPVAVVSCSADLRVVGGAEAFLVECALESDDVQDEVAHLRDHVHDLADVWDDMSAVQQRESEREAFAIVERITKLGAVVMVGKRTATLRPQTPDQPPMPFTTLYVVVAAEPKTHVAIPNKMTPTF